MKSMSYKIGPLENPNLVKDSCVKLNDYNLHSDSDSIEKDYDEESPNDEECESASHMRDGCMNEIIVVPGVNKAENFEDPRDHLSNSDTASSNESGFGTVDDEVDHDKPDSRQESEGQECEPQVIVYQPLQQHQNQGFINEMSSSGLSSPTQQSDNINKYPQPIKLPTLQGPRQIIYELNKNKKSDDNANILHDNSSINSSSSSDDTGRPNCMHSLFNRMNKCYYSCFCCYPTWLSIFCCCCPLLGCISLYLTNRSKKLKLNQKYAQAEKYSSYAEKLNIASLIFGVILYAIAVFMITLVIFMYWRHHNNS